MFSGSFLRAIRLTTNSFCKDTINILVSQEKMGDNIKKWRIFLLSLIFAVFLSMLKSAGCFIYDGGSPMFFQSDS